MPNRIIKDSICTSERIDSLSADAECFFYRVMVNCDDFGLLDARPAILKSKCYPLKSIDIKRIQVLTAELCEAGLIFIYQRDGRPYLKLKKWEKHQQIRAKRAKYPVPAEADELIGNHLISDDSNCTRNPIQSNPIQSESESKPITQKSAGADIGLVFSHWQQRMNHPGARLDDKRQKLIARALKLGYSTDDLLAAIDGCAKSPWHMGQNERGTVYDGLDLILRDGSKIDQFLKINQTPIRAGGDHGKNNGRIDSSIFDDDGGAWYERVLQREREEAERFARPAEQGVPSYDGDIPRLEGGDSVN